MKTTWLFAFVTVFISAAQIGCGSSDSGSGASAGAAGSSPGSAGNSGGSSGSDAPAIAQDADVRALSAADKGTLCDWVNAKLGGYGLKTQCTDAVSVSNDANQAECVSSSLNVPCKVTVAQVAACTLTEVSSHACDGDRKVCNPASCLPAP